MRRRLLALLTAAALFATQPAQAQIAVFDASTYAKVLQETQTALDQLKQLEHQVQQGEQLLTSLNQISNVNSLATVLEQPSVQAGATRLTGLQELELALNTAANARAVLDLQARAQMEQAMIANDQMRIQGLAMTQAGQAQVQTQRNQEQAAAASQARLSLYQAAFQ
jgi:hypothetical protein